MSGIHSLYSLLSFNPFFVPSVSVAPSAYKLHQQTTSATAWSLLADDSDNLSQDDSEYSHHNPDLPDCDGHLSSSSGSSFLADTDFASAVARAAKLSGLNVDGTTVSGG